MGLIVWLPMTDGTLKNYGLSNVQPTAEATITSSNDGKLGKCVKIGSDSGAIKIPHNDLLSYSGSFTVCFWVKFSSTTVAYSTVFSISGSSAAWAQEFICFQRNNTGNTYVFVISNGSSSTQGSFTTNALSNDVWYHFTLMQDSNKTMYIYQDGSLLKTNTISFTPNFAAIQNFKIGKSHTGYQGNFLINDFRFYTNTLSPREIKEISKAKILHYTLNRGGFGQDNYFYCPDFTRGTSSTANLREYNNGLFTLTANMNNAFSQLVPALNEYTSAKIPAGTYVFSIQNWVSDVSIHDVTGLALKVQNSSGSTFLLPNNTPTTLADECSFVEIVGNKTISKGSTISCRFMLEKGSVVTPWTPHSSDTLYSKMGLDDNIEYDVSGFGNNGTKVGDITYSSDTPRYNTGCFFNNNGYIDTSYKPQNQEEITIAFWFKFNVSQRNCLVSCYSGDNTGSFIEIESMNSKQLRIHFSDENKVLKSWILNNTPLIIGEWYFCAVTYAKNTHQVIVYINDDNSNNLNNYSNIWQDFSNIHSSIHNIRIGGMTQTSIKYNGYISDLRIYTTALSAEDILELYHIPITLSSNGTLLTQGEYVEV